EEHPAYDMLDGKRLACSGRRFQKMAAPKRRLFCCAVKRAHLSASKKSDTLCKEGEKRPLWTLPKFLLCSPKREARSAPVPNLGWNPSLFPVQALPFS